LGGVLLLSGAARAGGSVFLHAGTSASESASQPPLTLTIRDPAHGQPAGEAAETRWPAARLGGRFIAPGPVAQNVRKKFLLRDHARAQAREDGVVVAKVWGSDGARVPPGHAGL